MARVIFVRTRHVYQSYTDFWRLVDASEFETRYIDEIDLADDQAIYIFTPMNGEIVPCLSKTRRSKVIWWHLERPGIDPTTHSSLDVLDGLIDDVWVSDRWAQKLDSRFTYAFMASDARIQAKHVQSGPQAYDVAMLAYVWGRRQHVVDELLARGIKLAPNAWGQEQQDRVLAETRLILNVHQYADSPMVAPIRFAVAAAYAIPIVSEFCRDPQPGPVAESSIQGLPNLISTLLERDLRVCGYRLHERFCMQTNFRREIEKRLGL